MDVGGLGVVAGVLSRLSGYSHSSTQCVGLADRRELFSARRILLSLATGPVRSLRNLLTSGNSHGSP